MAILGYIGQFDNINNPPVTKDYAGDIQIFTTQRSYFKKFARRENNSTVVIPFSGITDDPVEYIDVNWYRDYTASYFTVVPVAYSGFDVQQIPLTEATHTVTGNILSHLTHIDMNYAELDTSGIIILRFENIGNPQAGDVRDYIFETVGRYNVSGVPPFNKGILNSNKNPINTPKSYKIYQNYPNPFNPVTKIKFDLPVNTNVTIKVYDLTGREVEQLINEYKYAGSYEIEWNASEYASGVYVYRIEAGNYINIRKMVLVK
jgi:hypothetical protein